MALSVPMAPVELPDSTTDLTRPPGTGRRWGGAGTGGATSLSAAPPRQPDGGGPPPRAGGVAVAAPRDSARAAVDLDSLRVALSQLPDTIDFHQRPYHTRFSSDYAATTAVLGSSGGMAGVAGLSFSDMLGNRTISVAAGIYGSITDSDIFLQYVDQSRRTISASVSSSSATTTSCCPGRPKTNSGH